MGDQGDNRTELERAIAERAREFAAGETVHRPQRYWLYPVGLVLAAGVVWAQPSQPNQTGTGQSPASSQQTQTQSTATGGQAGTPGTLDPNRRVCRTQETLGSRLRKRSVCRTAAEWDLLDRQAREDGKDLTNRSNINSTQPKMGGG